MTNSPKKTFYLILALDLLLVLVVGLLIWQIKEKKLELVEVMSKTSPIKSSEEQLLASSWSRLEPQLAILDSHFLVGSTTVEFLERLENTAKLTKTSFKINQADAKDNLRLNFSTQGSFSAINQFLTLLEKFPYALRIERLNLQTGDKGIWRGDFAIMVMIQK